MQKNSKVDVNTLMIQARSALNDSLDLPKPRGLDPFGDLPPTPPRPDPVLEMGRPTRAPTAISGGRGRGRFGPHATTLPARRPPVPLTSARAPPKEDIHSLLTRILDSNRQLHDRIGQLERRLEQVCTMATSPIHHAMGPRATPVSRTMDNATPSSILSESPAMRSTDRQPEPATEQLGGLDD